MDTCNLSSQTNNVDFEGLVSEMQTDMYWVRFFARPCCPAPDLQGATNMLDRLRGEVEEREDLSFEQKAKLANLIESRKEWYPKSGLCRTSRKG